jgi:hypothetical protein
MVTLWSISLFFFRAICMKKQVNRTHLQQPWAGSQRPLVVCAAAADTVRWFCVENTVISTPNHYSSWHFFIKSRVLLYISVIIYSWTICKWLNCAILGMDTKKKDHFEWNIKCDTRGGSEINDIAGWKWKSSCIGPIIIKQNHIKQE